MLTPGLFCKGFQRVDWAGAGRSTVGQSEIHDEESFARLFLPIFLRKPVRLDFDTASRFALDPRRELHSLGLSALLYEHRHDLKTWALFTRLLRERPVDDLNPRIAYIFALIPGHGDIYWHPGNTITEEFRRRVKEMMASWDQQEIVPLLRLMEMWDVERGTVGQSVYAVIDLAVSSPGPKLRAIVESTKIDAQSRQKALFLFCLVMQNDAAPFLTELSARGEFTDEVAELQRTLRECGFFPA
jgi:hypothetical protein